MPRRKSSSAVSGSTPKSHKRQVSSTNNTAGASSASGATRESKRLKESAERSRVSGRASDEKSKYFDEEEEEEEEGEEQADREGDEEEEDKEETDYEDEENSNTDDVGEDVYDSDDEENKKSNKKKKKKNGKITTSNAQNLWRPGVKTGLGPGKQVFIAKPKARDDGGIKYRADRIHPNTMLFLAELKANNDREWLKLHDPIYRQAWKDWESTVETLSERISQVDETIPELPPKDLVFRIYRDVRFSADQTPYKTHFSASWSRTGRKGPYAGYYVQIGPHGQNFVGSGLWMPEAQALAQLRNDIDQNPNGLRRVLNSAGIRKYIFNGLAKDENKAVQAFAAHNSGSALKTKPKGFAADHASIELLRLRSFTMGKRLAEQEILAANALSRIMEIISALVPFVTYLNGVVMPDPDENENEDENEDEDENENENENENETEEADDDDEDGEDE